MVKAFISGDAGFLGRHFATELVSRGWSVRGTDIKRTPTQDCREFFRANPAAEFDLVIHCAAVVGGRMKIDRAPLATAVSLALDAEMFRWASVARPGRVLYISSSAAYNVALQTLGDPHMLKEDWLRCGTEYIHNPDQVYGWSKVVGEVLATKLRETGVPVTVVRPFSGYGADQDLDYPFPSFIERAKARKDPFEVWGPGTQVRDFIHVQDLVRGALAVVDSGTESPVNLCTGTPTSFIELAAMVASAAGYEPEIERDPYAPTGVMYRVGDPTRMLQYYTPEISLEEGIYRALLQDS